MHGEVLGNKSSFVRHVLFKVLKDNVCVVYLQGVLTQVNQSTKAVLNLLGVFTVSSFHAYICARSPSLLSNLLAGRGASRKRSLPNNIGSDQVESRQNSFTTPKSFDEDDDFNESSLIHTKVPGKKVNSDDDRG